MNNLSIVDTNIAYSYNVLKRDIENLKNTYPFLKIKTIGKSVLGRDLFCFKLGEGDNKVFFNGAHHSLEWITSVILMKFTEDLCRHYRDNLTILNHKVEEIFRQSSLYIVPMVNPDGVDLVLNGLDSIDPKLKLNLIEWNNNCHEFSNTWQSNVHGVDLNHNYNASWDEYKLCEIRNEIYGPRYTRYGGISPESEPESRALAELTRNEQFDLVLALHSQGKEIYWNYENLAPNNSREIGEKLASASGYLLTSPEGVSSYSGYKDWFIKEFRKPGFTIEVGEGKNPLPISQFNEIYSDLLGLLLIACTNHRKA